MTKLLGLITANPMVLVWIVAGSFLFGLATGGSGAWTVQGWRLDAAKSAHKVFVAKVEALGEQAKADKLKKEKEHEKVLTDVSKAWQGSLDAAVTGAVARYARRMSGNNPGGGGLPSIASDPKAPDATGQEPMVARPSDGFIKDCAADAALIGSFHYWARDIGFPVK